LRLVELTGTPGSGKSTISPVIIKYVKSKGLKIFDRHSLLLNHNNIPPQKNFYITILKYFPDSFRKRFLNSLYRMLDINRIYMANFLLDNWCVNEATFQNISNTPLPHHKKNWLILWWLNLITQYQMARETLEDNSIIILDEGFYHKIINFFVHQNADLEYSKIGSYIKNIPFIDILIQIETNLENCLERLDNRDLPRLIRGSTPQELYNYLKKAKNAIEFSLDIISQKGTKIIKIDNSISPFSPKYIASQLSGKL
jgi:thymidylate kinase